MDVTFLALIAAIFIAAGIVKGISAMGLPALAMARLSFVMTPLSAAALMVVPSFASVAIAAATGIFAMPLVPYLQSIHSIATR